MTWWGIIATKEDWNKLDADLKKGILENPARKKLREEKKQHEVSAGTAHNGPSDEASVVTNSIDNKESKDRIVAAVIQGVMES